MTEEQKLDIRLKILNREIAKLTQMRDNLQAEKATGQLRLEVV